MMNRFQTFCFNVNLRRYSSGSDELLRGSAELLRALAGAGALAQAGDGAGNGGGGLPSLPSHETLNMLAAASPLTPLSRSLSETTRQAALAGPSDAGSSDAVDRILASSSSRHQVERPREETAAAAAAAATAAAAAAGFAPPVFGAEDHERMIRHAEVGQCRLNQ
jgi:hypothetical protein